MPPKTDKTEPEILAIAAALARELARADHEAEIARLSRMEEDARGAPAGGAAHAAAPVADLGMVQADAELEKSGRGRK